MARIQKNGEPSCMIYFQRDARFSLGTVMKDH